MSEEKNTSKSGIIEGPGGYNGKTPGSLEAPTKIYPNSSTIGRGASKTGGMIEGPASGKNTDRAGK